MHEVRAEETAPSLVPTTTAPREAIDQPEHGRCGACGRTISVTYGTAYFQLDADPAVFELAVRALAEGNSLRSTGRIVQVDKDTACAWLDRAARHCRLVMRSLWRQVPVAECQLDELWRPHLTVDPAIT